MTTKGDVMNRSIMVLVAVLLLLVACAPTAAETPAGEAWVNIREDVDVLVYASPL
jgi:hypothetical protein